MSKKCKTPGHEPSTCDVALFGRVVSVLDSNDCFTSPKLGLDNLPNLD
jgi:hypothetical protein